MILWRETFFEREREREREDKEAESWRISHYLFGMRD